MQDKDGLHWYSIHGHGRARTPVPYHRVLLESTIRMPNGEFYRFFGKLVAPKTFKAELTGKTYNISQISKFGSDREYFW